MLQEQEQGQQRSRGPGQGSSCRSWLTGFGLGMWLLVAGSASAENLVADCALGYGPGMQFPSQTGALIDIEGDLAVVGAPDEAAIRIYRWNAATCAWLFEFRYAMGQEILAVATNGVRVVVAADVSIANPRGGSSYTLFLVTPGQPVVDHTGLFPRPRALAYQGDVLVIAGRETGLSPTGLVAFRQVVDDDIPLISLHDITGPTFGPFHLSVAMDGDRVVVGDPAGDGRVHDFVRVADEFVSLGVIPPANTGQTQERFGWSVDLQGNTLVVGAPYTNWPLGNPEVDTGLVQVFEKGSLGFFSFAQLLSHTLHTTVQADDHAGTSVLIRGREIVVGVPGLNSFGIADAGAAFTWSFNGASWVAKDGVFPDSFTVGAEFGASLASDTHDLLVGAPGAANGDGQTYVFDSLFPIFVDDFETGDTSAWSP